MKSIYKHFCLTALLTLLTNGASSVLGQVTFSLTPQGSLAINGDISSARILNLTTASILDTGLGSDAIIDTLYVTDLYVLHTHAWDGVSVTVPQTVGAGTGAKTNQPTMLRNVQHADVAAVMDQVSTLRSELKAKDAQIEALQQAVAELRQAVSRLVPPTNQIARAELKADHK